MTSGDRTLQVHGLRAGYGSREVLHGIDLTVEPGSVSLILGSNGAGKTTTLGSIMGRVKRMGGTIQFGSKSLEKLDVPHVVQSGVQLVPEGGRVFRDFSVRDNLRLGAFTVPGRFNSKSLEPIFQIFPRLEERANQKAGTLSGGERQMVAIGRALMANPQLILLDEPFLGLAPVAIESVVAALSDINKRLGISLLIVESNVKAVEVADRAYVLSLGEVTAVEEEPMKLIEADSTAVREGFLGG
jgi:branched-chain amino acid transport system ATP-binding protein